MIKREGKWSDKVFEIQHFYLWLNEDDAQSFKFIFVMKWQLYLFRRFIDRSCYNIHVINSQVGVVFPLLCRARQLKKLNKRQAYLFFYSFLALFTQTVAVIL